MPEEKEIEGTLIVNWKTREWRAVKKKPKNLKASEIPIKLKLKLKLPEHKEYQATGEITISETKVEEMLIEEI